MSRVCFVCHKHDNDDKKVLAFHADSLVKCLSVSELRNEYGYLYSDRKIPTDLEAAVNSGYHIDCYRKFIAVQIKPTKNKADESSPSTSIEGTRNTRSQAAHLTCSSNVTGVLSKVCIFCQKSRKQVKHNDQPLFAARTENFEKAVRDAAKKLGDTDFLAQIGGNFVAKEVHYHNICWRGYLNKVPQGNLQTTDEPNRKKFEDVVSNMMDFIRINIIGKKEAYLLSTLFKQFLIFFDDLMEDEVCSYSAQHLEEKIRKTFNESVTITKMNNKKVVHHPQLAADQLQLLISANKDAIVMKQMAMNIRKGIKNIEPTTLPSQLTTESLKKGEAEIPAFLIDFLTNIVVGSKLKTRESDNTKRVVKSLAQDIIFAVSNGRIKPSKQIMLGLCINSLTNSKKVINILNRFGQTLSYTSLKEIETELCYTDAALSESSMTPSALIKSPNLMTGVAFDNNDRYVETPTGKDTLHDTVAVAHQILSVTSGSSARSSLVSVSSNRATKRRRAFAGDEQLIEPYKKKPKFVGKLSPLDFEKRSCIPQSLQEAHKRDFVWMLAIALGLPNIPMWIGFNSRTIDDSTPTQKICYLPPINESPTSTSVVLETMKRAKQIALECNQDSIIVTYDLAIAKIAFQVQCCESPEYDKLFIQMGDFHTMKAYFHGVGKYSESSGLSDVMVDSDVLASGSVNGFLTGTHFNRCKRLHPIVSVALQVLHFQSFLSRNNLSISPEIEDEIFLFSQTQSKVCKLSRELNDLMQTYDTYCDETLSGKYGKTAQFFFIYIKLINYFQIFSRSVREGDYSLYTYIIPKITNIFFALNQPNYARWLVKYHDNLMNLEKTHPSLISTVQSGCFAVKRTSNAFARSPVDITLEQTINADAANKLTGISHFTNSISARQRWARSHSIRTEIISSVLQTAGLEKNNDTVAELAPNRIKKDNEAVKQMINSFKSHVNPFDELLVKGKLFNCATGKSTQDDTADFLLKIEETGETLRTNFIKECSENKERFEEPIKRQKILTFANEQKKIVRKTSDINMQEEISNKNLFARLLLISTEHKIDITHVLKYPLTPVPRALSHADGSFTKTNKAALLHFLEKKITTDQPQKIDLVIIDGFFLLHTIGEVPRTMGQISRKFLRMVTQYNADCIHVIFDQYLTSSIKNSERQRREEHIQKEIYVIHGADQAKPANFLNCLRDDDFKKSFVKFLVSNWQEPELCQFLEGKSVIVNDEKTCYQFSSNNNVMQRVEVSEFACSHEEADTRIFFVVSKINTAKNIVVRCNDTDILVILLGNFHKISSETTLWLELGLFHNNSLRYLNVNMVYEKLGADLSLAMPGFHTFTGCDTTSCFFKRGKVNPFKLMEQDKEFVDCFKNIHKAADFSSSSKVIEMFVSRLYGVKNCQSVNEARYRKFELAFKPRKLNEPLVKSFSKFDSLSIPPCQSSLHQHLKRSIYQTHIWMNAHADDPTKPLSPETYGWTMDSDGSYAPVWFEGDVAPLEVLDAITNNKDDEEISFEDASDDDQYSEDE